MCIQNHKNKWGSRKSTFSGFPSCRYFSSAIFIVDFFGNG